jgi:hypothetical protein
MVDNTELWYDGCEGPGLDGAGCDNGAELGSLHYYVRGEGDIGGWYCASCAAVRGYCEEHAVVAAGVRGGSHFGQDPCPHCTDNYEPPFPRGRGWVRKVFRVTTPGGIVFEADSVDEVAAVVAGSTQLTDVDALVWLGHTLGRLSR